MYRWERPAAAPPAGSRGPAAGTSPCGPGAQPAVGPGPSGSRRSGPVRPSQTASPPPADRTAPARQLGAVQCSESGRSGKETKN